MPETLDVELTVKFGGKVYGETARSVVYADMENVIPEVVKDMAMRIREDIRKDRLRFRKDGL